jgi:hypothetical protein
VGGEAGGEMIGEVARIRKEQQSVRDYEWKRVDMRNRRFRKRTEVRWNEFRGQMFDDEKGFAGGTKLHLEITWMVVDGDGDYFLPRL